ncbi:hypothetical protein MKEN_00367400 [Mycena kentingensis (nom. inval.)]|nr:hypothetical protein MKEN_00367400 [Mycena kentingensis (nom. inval.)]
MRALLARASASSEDRDTQLDEATKRYLRIRNSKSPQAHLPYLRTMTVLRQHTHWEHTAQHLCRVLRRTPSPDPRFGELLWKVVLTNSTPKVQAEVIATLSSRLTAFSASSAPSQPFMTLAQLAHAFVSRILPTEHVKYSRAVADWVDAEAKAAVGAWPNVQLLALYIRPRSTRTTSATEYPTGWSTVLALAILERSITTPLLNRALQTTRILWVGWKQLEAPRAVQYIVVAAFFRLAGRTGDMRLLDACRQFCVDRQLWDAPPVLVDFALAARTARDWNAIFAALPSSKHTAVANALLDSTLYAFCRRHDIDVAARHIHALALRRAWEYFPADAISMLDDPRLSLDQLEDIFNGILSTLRREGHTYRDIPLASKLYVTLKRLYVGTDRVPNQRLQFSLRYVIALLTDSDLPAEAAALVRVLHQRQPELFSSQYLLRIMQVMVRRKPSAAVALLKPMQTFAPPAQQNFRTKLMFRLSRARQPKLAAYVYYHGGGLRRTARDHMLRAVKFRLNRRDGPPLPIRGPRVAGMALGNEPLAVELLARTHLRSALAIPRSDKDIASANMILNGALHGSRSRNARLVRHVLNMRERLGGAGDRVTLNVLVKALLRWRTYMRGPQIRRLFDHMLRLGYPAPRAWRVGHGGVFGQGQGDVIELGLKLSPFVSFERHVRPLYKMFVKALHLVGDREGAETVVGVLKAVGAEAAEHARRRRVARRAGLKTSKIRGTKSK